MREVIHLESHTMRAVARLEREHLVAKTTIMNEVADEVAAGGGACDEQALLASFFGVDTYDDSQGNARIPEPFHTFFTRAQDLQYALGEPIAYQHDGRISHEQVSIIGRNPDNAFDSPVVAYRIVKDADRYSGTIAINTFNTRWVSWKPGFTMPEEGLQRVATFWRWQDGATQSVIARPEPSPLVGMPAIRRALMQDAHIVGENVSRTFDYALAHLRSFAGEAVIGRLVDAAD